MQRKKGTVWRTIQPASIKPAVLVQYRPLGIYKWPQISGIAAPVNVKDIRLLFNGYLVRRREFPLISAHQIYGNRIHTIKNNSYTIPNTFHCAARRSRLINIPSVKKKRDEYKYVHDYEKY